MKIIINDVIEKKIMVLKPTRIWNILRFARLNPLEYIIFVNGKMRTVNDTVNPRAKVNLYKITNG